MSGSCSICSKCQSCQAFCETGSQLADSYYDTSIGLIEQNDIIIKKFTPAILNRIANNIVKAAAKGSQQNSGNLSWSEVDEDFVYARDINALRVLMQSGLLTASPPGEVAKDQVIYAQYFRDLNDALESMTIYSNACDKCNVTCDSCISCQHSSCHSSCHGSCHGSSSG